MREQLQQSGWDDSDGIFTPDELRRVRNESLEASWLTGCFAAKEAALKALGTHVEDLGNFREVEVVFGPSGHPSIQLHGRMQTKADSLGVKRIWVSIASAKKHAGALVVLEC